MFLTWSKEKNIFGSFSSFLALKKNLKKDNPTSADS